MEYTQVQIDYDLYSNLPDLEATIESAPENAVLHEIESWLEKKFTVGDTNHG